MYIQPCLLVATAGSASLFNLSIRLADAEEGQIMTLVDLVHHEGLLNCVDRADGHMHRCCTAEA